MGQRIFVEMEVIENGPMDDGFEFDPKICYELVPIEPGLSGGFDFVCRRSELKRKLRELDQYDEIVSKEVKSNRTSRQIYGEPEEDVKGLLDDFSDRVLGFKNDSFKELTTAIDELLRPSRYREKPQEREDRD